MGYLSPYEKTIKESFLPVCIGQAVTANFKESKKMKIPNLKEYKCLGMFPVSMTTNEILDEILESVELPHGVKCSWLVATGTDIGGGIPDHKQLWVKMQIDPQQDKGQGIMNSQY